MRGGWLVLVGLGACSVQTDVLRAEDAPVATIFSPTDGSQVASGRITMVGRVTDAVDSPDRLFAVWSLGSATATSDGGWVDVCSGFAEPDGTTRCTTDITTNDAVVRLLVKDIAGFQGQDFADVLVRQVSSPEVVLEAPTDDDGPWYSNILVTLQARVSDPDNSVDDLQIAWQSDLAGPLEGPDVPSNVGVVRGVVALAEGDHTITVTVTDPDGARATAQTLVVVRAKNEPPTVRIDAPAQGEGIYPDAEVPLLGVTFDAVTPVEGVRARWSSDRDGLLAERTPNGLGQVDAVVPSLSLGDHVLTLVSEDDVGFEASTSVTVHVDTPPTVEVLAPLQGATLSAGVAAPFSIHLEDTVTSAGLLTLKVSSDVQGPLFEMAPNDAGEIAVQLAMQVQGEHLLTFEATDSYGLVSVVERTITVGP